MDLVCCAVFVHWLLLALVEDQLQSRYTHGQISCLCELQTTLDVFAEMEKIGLLSNTNFHELLTVLTELDQQLALTVRRYKDGRPSHTHTHKHMHI